MSSCLTGGWGEAFQLLTWSQAEGQVVVVLRRDHTASLLIKGYLVVFLTPCPAYLVGRWSTYGVFTSWLTAKKVSKGRKHSLQSPYLWIGATPNLTIHVTTKTTHNNTPTAPRRQVIVVGGADSQNEEPFHLGTVLFPLHF